MCLGMQGNIEEALRRNQQTSNRIFNETNDRAIADTGNREAVEQSMTDYELDMIQTQQVNAEFAVAAAAGDNFSKMFAVPNGLTLGLSPSTVAR